MNKQSFKAMSNPTQLTEADLVYGNSYEGKKPARAGSWGDLVNDRQICYIGPNSVQYDSASVANGRKLTEIPKATFLKWAGRDVTALMPPGDWRKWEDCDKEVPAAVSSSTECAHT